MTTRGASLVAWSLCAISIGLAALGLAYLFLSLDAPVPSRWGFRGFPALFVVELSVIGALIASRQPRNPIGWLFVFAGLFNSLQLLGEEHAVYAGAALAESAPAVIVTWIADWIWVLIAGPMLTSFSPPISFG